MGNLQSGWSLRCIKCELRLVLDKCCRPEYLSMYRFGIEFAPEVVLADGNVRNLSWRVCNAKKVLVSIPKHYCRVLPPMYEGLADNEWIRNLTCRYLVAKVHTQSQGISPAALVAFESAVVPCRHQTMVQKVVRYTKLPFHYVYKLVVHTHKSLPIKVSASNVEKIITEISTSFLLCDQIRPLRKMSLSGRFYNLHTRDAAFDTGRVHGYIRPRNPRPRS